MDWLKSKIYRHRQPEVLMRWLGLGVWIELVLKETTGVRWGRKAKADHGWIQKKFQSQNAGLSMQVREPWMDDNSASVADNLRKVSPSCVGREKFSPLLPVTRNSIFVSFTAFSQRKLLLCYQLRETFSKPVENFRWYWKNMLTTTLPSNAVCQEVKLERHLMIKNHLWSPLA